MTATTTPETAEATSAEPDDPAAPAPATPLVTGELLVEDVSIDGMCGVY